MGYKMGTSRQPYMSSGQLTKKMSFQQSDASVPGNPVIRKKLAPGILGEANSDGTIFISDKVQPGSALENKVLLHEMKHATDLRVGKIAYGDDYVRYNGITYPREMRNGKDMIKYEGRWKEAGEDFPWENDANNKKNGH